MIITRYAYKEKDGHVTIYDDDLGKSVVGQYKNYMTNKPTKRNKRIVMDCWTFNLQWITFRFTTFEEYLQKRLLGF